MNSSNDNKGQQNHSFSPSMLQHLVQNRWNHVRSIEVQYNTDKENITLKKEIVALKEEIKQTKEKSNKNIKVFIYCLINVNILILMNRMQ